MQAASILSFREGYALECWPFGWLDEETKVNINEWVVKLPSGLTP